MWAESPLDVIYFFVHKERAGNGNNEARYVKGYMKKSFPFTKKSINLFLEVGTSCLL